MINFVFVGQECQQLTWDPIFSLIGSDEYVLVGQWQELRMLLQ